MRPHLEKEPLPQTFADGMDYFDKVLLPYDPWFEAHRGQYVAISGDRVVAFDPDPHYLANHIREQFAETIMYMPHVVRLPVIPEPGPEMAALPPHFLQAIKYYEFLRADPTWLQAHMGQRVAIIGQQVVDEQSRGETQGALLDRVYGKYGYRALFMPNVKEQYPIVIVPRLTR